MLHVESLPADRESTPRLPAGPTDLYASDRAFHRLSGDFPDPEDIRPEQVAATLAEDLATPGGDVLTARTGGSPPSRRPLPTIRTRPTRTRGSAC